MIRCYGRRGLYAFKPAGRRIGRYWCDEFELADEDYDAIESIFGDDQFAVLTPRRQTAWLENGYLVCEEA